MLLDKQSLLSKIRVLCLAFTLSTGLAHSVMSADRQLVPIGIATTAFRDHAVIPKQYTGDGADISPALRWSTPPKGTVTLALSCEDPDAPRGTWWHWIIFNIPPSKTSFGENVPKTPTFPDGTTQGTNDFKKIGYNGPAPPSGQTHRYMFKLVALDSKLSLPAGCSKEQYSAAIQGHILGSGTVTGTFSH